MIRLLTSLAALFTIGSIQALSPVSNPPKLVIGITIDQLRGDYLQLFQNTFSERGFNRLLNNGLVYQNIKFDFPNINAASAITTIYTGTVPSYHSIVSDKIYSVDKGQEVAIFGDAEYMGNYTQDKLSPKALKSSTITDELKIASHGRATVYSFAPDDYQSLITAGKKGNCAFWINGYTGEWSSSTYYSDFHWVVDRSNSGTSSYTVKVPGMTWLPLLKKEQYNSLPYNLTSSFQQNFGSDKETFSLFKKSAIVNESIIDISSQLMNKAELGKSVNPDFLAINLYAGRYDKVGDYSIEIQDTYARLDRELEKLLDNIEKHIGLNNTLIFLSSTGYYDSEIEQLDKNQTKETFYINRCKSLLNMYLMAIYGREGQWVSEFYDNQIFLNRKLIEDKKISLEEIQQKAAEFVAEFTGVHEVYTSHRMKHGAWSPIIGYLSNGMYQKTAGDLFVEIEPGYTIVDESNEQIKEKEKRNNAVVCPVIFFGNNITPQRVNRTINATEIAPSVTHILRIRSPNASREQALKELLVK